MTEKNKINKFITENLDYHTTIPEIIKSIGWNYRQYSKLIGRSERWLDNKLNGDTTKKLNKNDFKTLELAFNQKFPNTNFNDYVYSVTYNNAITHNKKKLHQDIILRDQKINELENEIKKLNIKISELASPQNPDEDKTSQGGDNTPPNDLEIKGDEE